MKKNVKIMLASLLTFQKLIMLFYQKNAKRISKKSLEGEFFEGLIQRSFSIGEQIREIYWMCFRSADKL